MTPSGFWERHLPGVQGTGVSGQKTFSAEACAWDGAQCLEGIPSSVKSRDQRFRHLTCPGVPWGCCLKPGSDAEGWGLAKTLRFSQAPR